MLVRKVQKTITGELEKRFAGRVVTLVAQRKVTKRPADQPDPPPTTEKIRRTWFREDDNQ